MKIIDPGLMNPVFILPLLVKQNNIFSILLNTKSQDEIPSQKNPCRSEKLNSLSPEHDIR